MKKLISIISIIMMILIVMTGNVFAEDSLLDFSDPTVPELGGQLTGGSEMPETPETPEEPETPQEPEQPVEPENTNTNTDLPETGIADTTAILVGGIFCAVVGTYAYKKMRYYADI